MALYTFVRGFVEPGDAAADRRYCSACEKAWTVSSGTTSNLLSDLYVTQHTRTERYNG